MTTPIRETMDDFINRTGVVLEARREPKTGCWSAELRGYVYDGTNPPICAIVFGDSFPGVVRGLLREIAGKAVRPLADPAALPVKCPEELTVGTMLD